jgi:hypothetical protein
MTTINEINKRIDLSEVRVSGTRVYSGQPRGKAARQQFRVDALDREDGVVTVLIPPDTYSIGPSFLLGLFEPSIIKLGKDGFFAKYKFPWDAILLDSLHETVARATKTSTVLRSSIAS